MLVLLRRYGCGVCRDAARVYSGAFRRRVEDLGGQVVGVGHGFRGLSNFLAGKYWRGELLIDCFPRAPPPPKAPESTPPRSGAWSIAESADLFHGGGRPQAGGYTSLANLAARTAGARADSPPSARALSGAATPFYSPARTPAPPPRAGAPPPPPSGGRSFYGAHGAPAAPNFSGAADAHGAVGAHFGARDASPVEAADPSMLRSILLAKSSTEPTVEEGGPFLRLGGVVVLRRDGSVALARLQSKFDDAPPLDDILDAMRSPVEISRVAGPPPAATPRRPAPDPSPPPSPPPAFSLPPLSPADVPPYIPLSTGERLPTSPGDVPPLLPTSPGERDVPPLLPTAPLSPPASPAAEAKGDDVAVADDADQPAEPAAPAEPADPADPAAEERGGDASAEPTPPEERADEDVPGEPAPSEETKVEMPPAEEAKAPPAAPDVEAAVPPAQ